MFKVNNKDRTKPLASFWCLCFYFWIYFTPCSSVFIVNFEQVNACWEPLNVLRSRGHGVTHISHFFLFWVLNCSLNTIEDAAAMAITVIFSSLYENFFSLKKKKLNLSPHTFQKMLLHMVLQNWNRNLETEFIKVKGIKAA